MTMRDQPPRVRWGLRFSPHVLPLLATVGLAWIPFSSAIAAGLFWWWGPTYRQVEFVMAEAHANQGYPYIDGHVAGDTDLTRISGMMVGERIAPEGAPAETFAPGRRILIWQSPSAPDIGVQGHSTNDVSVAARPALPGLASFLSSLTLTALIALAGLRATAWVYQRYSRKAGELDIRGAGRSTRAS